MLQLPTSIIRARHFTKTEIADMTRGAKIKNQRAAKPKADPLVKIAQAAMDTYDRYVELDQEIEILKEKHDEKVFKHPAVHLPSEAVMLVTLNVNDRTFITQAGIDRWVKKHRDHYQNEARANKRPTLKLAQTVHTYTRKQALERLQYVNRLEPLLKKALRKREREVNALWRKIGYSQLRRKKAKAYDVYHSHFSKLLEVKPQSIAGARAITDFLHHHADLERRSFRCGKSYGQIDAAYLTKLLRSVSRVLGASLR